MEIILVDEHLDQPATGTTDSPLNDLRVLGGKGSFSPRGRPKFSIFSIFIFYFPPFLHEMGKIIETS